MKYRNFVNFGIFFVTVCLLLVTACSEREESAVPAETPLNDKKDRAEQAPEPQPVYYVLNYQAETGGSLAGQASQQVAAGATGSQVTAVAADGYHFVSWSDGLERAERVDQAVEENLTVTATFALNQYTLSYQADGTGAINGDVTQQLEHGADGTAVKAIPAANHHFVAWSDGIESAERTERNLTSDLTLTARFAADRYPVTYAAGENGAIDGASSQRVAHGNAGSAVTAVPDKGYHFVDWSDGYNEARRIDRDVTADLAATARFAMNRYQVTYSAGEHGTLEGDGAQTVTHGEDPSAVRAVADPGYHFVAWSDGLATAERSDREVMSDLKVSARFAPDTYVVGGIVTGLVEGTRLLLKYNADEDLEISADGVFQFTTELLDGAPYDVVVLAQPEMPNQTCTISAGNGVVDGEDVAEIRVECVLQTYTVGGVVSGLLDGDEIVLQIRDGGRLDINANGPFVFPEPIEDGRSYEVEVLQAPARPNWTCEVHNHSGMLAGEDIGDVEVDCYPQLILQAVAGISRVHLDWNARDFTDASFDLCQAREEAGRADFDDCQQLTEGRLRSAVVTPLVVENLTNNQVYYFLLRARYADKRVTYSEPVAATPFGGLNDTGIDWCADSLANRWGSGNRGDKIALCEELAVSYPGQDAMFGRDKDFLSRKLKKKGAGTTGFDFTKLCRSGEAAGEGRCPPNPMPGDGLQSWACNRDNVTGLVWELKEQSGLRAANNTYSWYQPDDAMNGGSAGLKNGGVCQGSACDTLAYLKAVNQQRLCGISDWRLPTRKELLSIVDNGRLKPALDVRQFPQALPLNYWTSSPYAEDSQAAWQVYFLYGETSPEDKTEARSVRLVSGQTVTFGMDNP